MSSDETSRANRKITQDCFSDLSAISAFLLRSGTASAILNRESGNSEARDVIPGSQCGHCGVPLDKAGCIRDSDSILRYSEHMGN